MPDEELPLIVRPDVALRVADTRSGRILSEMVTGALDIASSASLVEERAELEFRIGEDYYYGRGKPQSYAKAVKHYHAAAKNGHLDALCNLGFMFALGRGVKRDYKLAFSCFSNAKVELHVASTLNWYSCCHVSDQELGPFSSACECDGQFTKTSYMRRPLFTPLKGFEELLPPTLPETRTKNYITTTEPHFNSMDAFPSGHWYAFRKVRIDHCPPLLEQPQVVVIDPGDSGIFYGDLVHLTKFEAINEFVDNDGGKPAIGIPFGESPTENSLVTADLQAIMSNFYQRGIGVQQDDAESARWHARSMIGK